MQVLVTPEAAALLESRKSWWRCAFTSVSQYCSPPLTPAPVTEAVAQEFDLAQIVEVARGTFESELRWDLGPNPPAAAPPPGGYRSKSKVQGSLALGDPVYYNQAPGAVVQYGCWRMIRIPAVVNVSTADGAIAAETQGALTIVAGDFPGRWTLETFADLATVSGSLDLRLPPSAPERGYLHVAMIPCASSQGSRGVIAPNVWIFASVADALAYDPSSDVISNAEASYPIGGRWPDDECDFDHLPIEANAPNPGSTATHLRPGCRATQVAAAAGRHLR
jgi:hypothetical protein